MYFNQLALNVFSLSGLLNQSVIAVLFLPRTTLHLKLFHFCFMCILFCFKFLADIRGNVAESLKVESAVLYIITVALWLVYERL